MRPRLFTAEDETKVRIALLLAPSFNEAAAIHRGRLSSQPKYAMDY